MTGRQQHLPASFTRAQALLRPVLQDAVGRLSAASPALHPLIIYQFGWADEPGAKGGDGEGKGLRPTITMLSAEAVGGAAEDALLGAVALELIHTFSLVHDDVMDEDPERRHRPSLWAKFGRGPAIGAGDSLAALAYDLVLSEPAYALQAGREFSAMTIEMILGQSEDLEFQSRSDVTESEWLGMASRKTGALFACSAALGAMLGSGDHHQISALRCFGRLVGIAFQAIDDLLGIWGDPATTGKPVASDVRERKKSLPIVHVLTAGNGAAAQLRQLFEQPVLDRDDVDQAVAILTASDALRWTRAFAQEHVEKALEQLSLADLEVASVDELRKVALFVISREW